VRFAAGIPCSFLDIDVSATGLIAAGARDGTVWVANTQLGGAHALSLSSWNTFVAFAPAVVPVPAAAWLFGGGLGALVCLRRRPG
jgi:hypothetical protein